MVRAVAHAARLDHPSKDGTTERQHLQGLLKRYAREEFPDQSTLQRIARFEARLEGPPIPAALQYLIEWLDELYGRSGVGMEGFSPLTYTTIAHWSTLTGRAVLPHEVHALILLDAVRRNPPPEEDDDG